MERPPDAKHVKFSEDTKVSDATFTPLRKLHFSAIRKKWFEYFDQNDYVGLKQYLSNCEQKGVSIQEFFSKEGRLILTWAVTNAPNLNALHFLCENIPTPVLREVLKQNAGSVLKALIASEIGMEACHWTSQTSVENRVEKFRLLLAIDAEEVHAGMETIFAHGQVSEKVVDSFGDSLKQYGGTPGRI